MLFVLVLASVAFVALSGCVQPPICGNGICERGEDQPGTATYCPQDCMPETGTINGYVRDGTGDGVEFATVSLMMEDYTVIRSEITRFDGYYRFEEVPTRSYAMKAEKEGYSKSHKFQIIVKSGKTTMVNFKINKEFCGDGICQPGENWENCPEDCRKPECVEAKYYEGQTIKELEGAGAYAGQELYILFAAVTQPLSSESYSGRFELHKMSGGMIDTQTVLPMTELSETFVDAKGNLALKTYVLVHFISVDPTTQRGFALIEVCEPITAPEAIKFEEGSTITGLIGRGKYKGQGMVVKLDKVTLYGSLPDMIQARFELYDSKNNLVDSQTLKAGKYLNENFVDSTGEYALATEVYISNIPADANTVQRTVEVTIPEVYSEGETIIGLQGAGNYAGAEMSVEVAAVAQPYPAGSYQARFELYDPDGNLVDHQTLSEGVYLNENFVDLAGYYALGTKVYVSKIGVEPETSKGMVEVTIANEYNEGEIITALRGMGNYRGQAMSVGLVSVIQPSPTALYAARFELNDQDSGLVDQQTLGMGTYLNENFVDHAGQYAMASEVYVSKIYVDGASAKGIVEIKFG